jgi:hypothetical protein
MGETSMDNFNLTPVKQPPSGPRLWNILTIVVLVGICCLAGYFLSIFINPNSGLNLFPPPAVPTTLHFPTPTITPILPPATWTPSPTIQPLPTRTEAPTWTPIPTNTLYFIAPRFTPTRIPIPSSTLKPTNLLVTTTITYMNSTTFRPDAGCNWFGIAGRAVDKNDAPILYLTIQVGGTLNGQPIKIMTLTGIAPDYGQSGFELNLGDQPVASQGTLWIQLLEQDGTALTDQISFDTYEDCNKNLIMVRFKKTR